MKKKVTLAFLVLIGTMNCCPVYGQENINNTNTTEYVEDYTEYLTDNISPEFSELIVNNIKHEMYCTTDGVNVREEPSTECKILGQLAEGVSVEAIAEYNGWTCITTQDGIAFVCSNYLSNEPVECKSYTEEDLYYLTGVLVGECHGYSWEHQIAVGSVVLNRVSSSEFPNTIKEVVLQRRQYSCVRNGMFYRKPTERNIAVAKFLLENGSQIPSNVIFQSRGKQGSGIWRKIDNQFFCYR